MENEADFKKHSLPKWYMDKLIHVPVIRKVQQGEVFSPLLFLVCFVNIERGVNINGEILQYILSRDDIVLVAHRPEDSQRLVVALNELTQKFSLEMHHCNYFREDQNAKVNLNGHVNT